MMKEELYPIKDYDNYMITKSGKIWSNYKMRFLKWSLGQNGYYTIRLYNNKKSKLFYIHRLIAVFFIENLENKPCINHKNGIKTDNRIENLEWCTISEFV